MGIEVTVIIPNFNGKHFLERCLRSLSLQKFRDFHTIIVDNGSQDGSIELIKEQFPWAELLKRDKNYGFCNAVNIGIKGAATPYVLLLNNDTEAETDFVGELYHAIRKDRKIFSVSSRMLHFTERDILDDAGDMYAVTGWQFQRGVGLKKYLYDRPAEVFSACAGAAIYRKAVFDEIGYFDEMHFAYLEDMDLGYRARIYGYRNTYCPKAEVYHVGSGTSGSKYNDFKVKLSARNSVYLNYKNMPSFFLVINSIPLLAGYFLKYLFFVRKGFGKTYLEGVLEGIRTRKNCRKVKFRTKHLSHYIRIEFELIRNAFLYLYEFLRRKLK